MSELRELYQELIIDHGRNPRNFGVLQNANYTHEGFNPLCGDRLTVYLFEKNGVIQEVQFEGAGCAISMASASLMTEMLKGKTFQDVEKIFEDFHRWLTERTAQSIPEGLGKLMVMGGVREFPARVKCATLAWHTVRAAIHNESEVVCTELPGSAGSSPAINKSGQAARAHGISILPEIPLLQFSNEAIAHIKKIMERRGANAFRVSVKKTGCSGYSVVPEVVNEGLPNDCKFLSNDLVVYVDSAWEKILRGTQVNLVQKSLGMTALQFDNPNAEGMCGCGESFHLKENTEST